MNPKSAEALVGAVVLSLLFGMLILSPHGSLFFYGLAAVFAAVPAIFGGKRLRVVSAVVLVVSLAAAANVYPEYANYLERIKSAYQNDVFVPPHPALSPVIGGEGSLFC